MSLKSTRRSEPYNSADEPVLVAVLRKRKTWIVGVALIGVLLLAGLGATIWADPPVQYYGRWIRQHELFERQNTPVMCVQLYITDWYRHMAQFFPAPSSFICFNTDAEARRWMLVNKP